MQREGYSERAASLPQPAFGSEIGRLAYIALGLAGEADEVADTVRRSIREGNREAGRLVYELSDLIFHWTCLITALGHSPSNLFAQSRDNIEARRARQ